MTDSRPLIYSAHNLQAFVDCERRFELTYLQRLTWPALPVAPPLDYERLMADGRRFHQMVQQDLLGAAVLEPTPADSDDVGTWWENYGRYDPAAEVEGERFVERMVLGTVGPDGPPLVAAYDLVVWDGQQAVIFDWKTSKREELPRREWLLERLQTRVYRYLLASAGAVLTGGAAIAPDAIRMIYWYAGIPDRPVVLDYDAGAFARDERFLMDLVGRIERQRDGGAFPLTIDEVKCRYCNYRSFCGRGEVAGPLMGDEADDVDAVQDDLLGDLDAIEAIAFS